MNIWTRIEKWTERVNYNDSYKIPRHIWLFILKTLHVMGIHLYEQPFLDAGLQDTTKVCIYCSKSIILQETRIL